MLSPVSSNTLPGRPWLECAHTPPLDVKRGPPTVQSYVVSQHATQASLVAYGREVLSTTLLTGVRFRLKCKHVR